MATIVVCLPSGVVDVDRVVDFVDILDVDVLGIGEVIIGSFDGVVKHGGFVVNIKSVGVGCREVEGRDEPFSFSEAITIGKGDSVECFSKEMSVIICVVDRSVVGKSVSFSASILPVSTLVGGGIVLCKSLMPGLHGWFVGF